MVEVGVRVIEEAANCYRGMWGMEGYSAMTAHAPSITWAFVGFELVVMLREMVG